ncbi:MULTISPECIES: hypothetical protein [unclassified Duganella]|uniref:hypothetical protein n=1 Tax=unclassified Duganella TaxID=2636909 RepID=UPI0006F3DD05|nr:MULTISPECIES: hypothetical protein [unclassified Duganella]KQV45363.1 hypothetical protein ASD07_17770 [Duganella sp. Root336D2]KRC02719.1 hypothetical protein ASE26_15990 [Duganella sp. Root198D2]
MSSSNETRKPAGRPSLLTAEQQNALENQPASPAEFEPPLVAEAPRRKHLWIAGGVSVLVVAVALAFVSFGDSEPAAETLAATPAPAPATPPAVTPAAANAVVAETVQPADNSPLAALTAPAPQVAAIIDESPPPVAGKPKESLKQMLEGGAPAASRPVAAKAVRKPAKEKPVKEAEPEATQPSAEEENDLQLLAALVAHAKYDTSASARVSLPKALDQCKKQGKQDAARCRIRVCEGRWKKNECRVYSRSKLEKTATGA